MPGGDKLDQETQYYVGNNNIYAPHRYGVDHERVFTGTLSFRTPEKGHKPIMMANFQKALDTGNVEAIFNARARQLVKDDAGRIVGVIFEDVTTGERSAPSLRSLLPPLGRNSDRILLVPLATMTRQNQLQQLMVPGRQDSGALPNENSNRPGGEGPGALVHGERVVGHTHKRPRSHLALERGQR